MNELSILNSNNFSNFIGKKSIIVGDLVPSKTSLLSQLLLHAIDLGYDKKITLIEMCPTKTVHQNIKLTSRVNEYIDDFSKITYLTSRTLYWPRIKGNNSKDVLKYSIMNSRNLNVCLTEFKNKPTKILLINDINFYLHMGALAYLLKIISKSSTFIGTCFHSKFPYDDYNTGISRRERRLIDKLTLKMDKIIRV